MHREAFLRLRRRCSFGCLERVGEMATSLAFVLVLATSAGLAVAGPTAQSTAGTPPTIVGGQDTNIEEVPWQVALTDEFGNQFCGGSIIAPRWILTAAHCQDVDLKKIRAGVTDRRSSAGQDIAILRMIPHPEYSDSGDSYDIMLLELALPLDLSGPRARAIPIMTAAAAASGLQNPGVVATITGWGDTTEGGSDSNILQKATLPIVSNAQAAADYLKLVPPIIITDDMLAAGYAQGGVDTCQGDSGGPLVVRDPTVSIGYRLAGATSFGEGCARAQFPGIYARVSTFETWIALVTTGSSPPAPVPTLGDLARILLGLLLAGLGAQAIRAGRAAPSCAARRCQLSGDRLR